MHIRRFRGSYERTHTTHRHLTSHCIVASIVTCYCSLFVMVCRVFCQDMNTIGMGGSGNPSKSKGSSSQKGKGKEKEPTNLTMMPLGSSGK